MSVTSWDEFRATIIGGTPCTSTNCLNAGTVSGVVDFRGLKASFVPHRAVYCGKCASLLSAYFTPDDEERR